MKYFFSSLLLIALFSNFANAANPDIFYYVSDGTNQLFSINRVTGVKVLIGPTTGATNIEAIAFYPIPGANQLFAADGGDFGTLNITTGAYTTIGEIDGGGTANGSSGPQDLDDVDGLMLDGQTFKMWAIERKNGATPDLLFQIDVTTGLFVANAFGSGIDYLVISGTGIDVDADDLAVDPGTGKIYASSNDNGSNNVLVEINKYTGVFTFVANLSEDDVEGLAFSNNGQLYGSEGDGNNRLGEINHTTGVVSNFTTFAGFGSDVEALASLVADANTGSGTVYDDLNFNGVEDGGEPGIANVRVYLYIDNNSDGKVDPEDTRVQSTLSDVNGDYSFLYASTGSLLTSTQFSSYPASFALTTDNVEAISFTDAVNFAETDANNNFGLATGPDCDGDGLPDFFEGIVDSDGDGVANQCDLDSDNDGIRDDVEGTEDFDDDGIPDYIDRDSDDDGIPDAIEANAGILPVGYNAINGNIDGAVGANGIVDVIETAAESGTMIALNPDSDGDGKKDYRDLDSDNDGILDLLEAGGVDVDGDGQVDGDTDVNDNGYSDLLETTGLTIPNTDAAFEGVSALTLLPDYIDIDSDSDGIDDTREGLSTANYRFPSLVLDSDDDGIIDFWDVSTFNTPITPYDRDGDGTPDYQDSDSDNDGVTDLIEGNDANSDGVVDVTLSGLDANQNGLDDAFDGDCGNSAFSTGGDYGEETFSDGSMYITSSDLEFVTDAFNGGRQLVGLYFPNVNVGQGETVNSTYIQFETDEVETGAVTITINGELIANAPAFTTANSNISARTLTARSETWSPADWNAVGEIGLDQRTVDISLIIQEIVNQGAWVRGNNIAIVFSGPAGNTRTAEVDPIITIVVNNGICGSNVAVQDFDGDGERDWRDTDDDEDGIATISEIPDADVSGTPDYLEFDGDGCSNGFTSSGTTSTNNGALESESGVDRDTRILGAPNDSEAEFENNNDEYVMDFNQTYNVGVQYVIRWRKQDGGGDPAIIVLSESADNITFTDVSSFPTTSSTTLIDETITSSISFRYLRFRLEDASSNDDFEIDAITVLEPICEADNDNDGILDVIDIDDDNDGILDTDDGCVDAAPGPSGPVVASAGTSGSLTQINDGVLTANAGIGLNAVNEYIVVDLGSIIPSGTDVVFTLWRNNGSDREIRIAQLTNATAILGGAGGTNPSTIVRASIATGGSVTSYTYTLNANTRYIQVEMTVRAGGRIEIVEATVQSYQNCEDTDQDGIADRLDLDSDNDGIADIIESGGVDADNNGRVDAYTDDDADGWANTFDSDDGGTALADADTDGDGFENRIDIDADDDGIVDVIEAQLSGSTPSLPSGVDSDGDGVDDSFDSDLGNNLLVPINTDGSDTPDYIDTDSDNDGDLDILEGWDTDNDGIADTSPAGTDSDNDGLDDNFDAVAGINSGLNVSNNAQTSESFPDNDNSYTPERDWRELMDNDSDGITDILDLDDDNDGILDTDEGCVSGGGPSGAVVAALGTSGSLAQINDGILTADEGVAFNTVGDYIVVDLGTVVPSGTNVVFTLWKILDDNKILRFAELPNSTVNLGGGSNASTIDDVSIAGGASVTSFTYTLASNTRYVQIEMTSRNSGRIEVVEVTLDTYAGCLDDSDNDGIIDAFDLDSDNDGIPDIVESGGEDTDGNGLVDDINVNGTLTADTDTDGLADVYDANSGGTAISNPDTDGDGVKDYLDLDSDNDGIPDVVEAGGTDANGDGRADDYVDTDGDGFNDIVDGDVGQDGTSENSGNALLLTGADTGSDGIPDSYPGDDNDGDGVLNQLDLDADNDGIPDVVEAGGTDENGDGRVDGYTDADTDGFNDVVDGDPTNVLAVGTDTPGANSTNALVLTGADTDNNGAPNTLPSGDFDQDGVYNFLDLDADGDGILDVLEAGGTDTDRDGIEDGFVDADNDGFNDNVDGDPDNSLTAGDDSNDSNTANATTLTGPDTDADGIPNSYPNDDFDGDTKVDFLDIDSDNDGIVDNTEGQLTVGYLAPLNTDVDGDGIDTQYDVNDASFGSAGSGLTPIDTDVADEPDSPDYLDLDSDEDGFSDAIEGHDTDNDKLADAGSPANTGVNGGTTDIDNDGLLDGFDNNTASNDPTNTNLQGNSHPNITNPISAERDWREIADRDNDGISDLDDVDDDNDGILDIDECDRLITNEGFEDSPSPGFGNNLGVSIAPWIMAGGGGTNVIRVDGPGGANYGIGGPEFDARGGAGNYFDINGVNGIIYQTFTIASTETVRYSTFYSARDNSSGVVEALIRAGTGLGGAIQSTTTSVTTSDNTNWQFIENTVTLSPGTYSFVLDIDNFINVDEASVSFVCDEDNDGISNEFDLDSDNDGISDLVEAGGVDTDDDGKVDGFVDTDGDGWANTFDFDDGGTALQDGDQDGDGIVNRIDLDADDDGLQDILEAGGVDTNNDGEVDDNTDTDNDGLADTFDTDNGGTALTIPDTDSDGTLPNYLDLDTDNDGIIDNIEWQTTANFDVPSAIDASNNGWDDEYDVGGVPETISNNDGLGDPDYIDLNSDGDAQPDWLERADDDEDGDALLDLIALADAYETANANPNHYVSTDDADTDGIPDFLEDAGGLPAFLTFGNALYRDTDNDGLVDFYDADHNGDNRENVNQLIDLDNDGSPDFRDTDNDVTLPIELINFKAIKVGAYVQLDWSTATEINNDYFTIERSIDGDNFEEILTEKGAGNSSRKLDYRRYDESPQLGYNYYRLSQTDFNGESERFNIEVVKFEGGLLFDNDSPAKMKVYPNPTEGDQLTFSIDKLKAGKVVLEIRTAEGQLINEQQLNVETATTNYQVEVLQGKNLAAGTYYLRVISQDRTEVLPFIVQ